MIIYPCYGNLGRENGLYICSAAVTRSQNTVSSGDVLDFMLLIVYRTVCYILEIDVVDVPEGSKLVPRSAFWFVAVYLTICKRT